MANRSFYTYLLEVGSSREDLVDEVLDGEDVELAKSLLDDLVVGERNALLVDLAVAALVDELPNSLQVRLATKIDEYATQTGKFCPRRTRM